MTEASKTLLIIDDEQDIIDIYKFHFAEDEGYRVLAASNGEEALEVLNQNIVDLIISDVKMPRIDGLSLLKILVEKYGSNRPHHIFVSGHSEVTEDYALSIGAAAYLEKPVGLIELTELVNSLLE